MRLKQGARSAALLALGLLWAAPACAHGPRWHGHGHGHGHRDRYEHRGHDRGHGDRHHDGRRDRRRDDHGRRHGSYRTAPTVFTHFVHGRPVRVVMHQPYYCAQCNRHFKRENAFHRHLRRQHRIAHRIRHHLARVGWGWVYFG